MRDGGFIVAMSLLATFMSGCVGGRTTHGYNVAVGGDAERGSAVILKYQCGKCHVIPGIENANGVFGPPLNWFGRRTMIAGQFPNAPETLEKWVLSPTEMKPKTTMPQLGLDEQEARDVAAYLYTLR